MAGFRLAPRAARARRNPWQRKRRIFSAPLAAAGSISDGFSVSDGVTYTLALHKTAADGFTISDGVVGATPSSGTATGGLIFLFSQGSSGSAFTRTATDGFTIADSVSRVVTPVATNSFSRVASDVIVLDDVVSSSVVALGDAATLVGVDLEFTAGLDVELSFVGE